MLIRNRAKEQRNESEIVKDKLSLIYNFRQLFLRDAAKTRKMF